MSSRLRKFGPRLTVSLTPKDHEQLNAIAEQNGASVSWVLRRAIEEYLSKMSNASEKDALFQHLQKLEKKNHAA